MRKAILWMVLGLVLAGCAAGGPVTKSGTLEVQSPWVRTAKSGDNSAAFMVIKNTGAAEDTLVKAECAAAGEVTLMDTQMTDGKMQMLDVAEIRVPAGGQVELKSGGYHVMLLGLKQDLQEGQTVALTLTFAGGTVMQLDVPVKKTADAMPMQ